MSKHPTISKSKNLDVPIIITSTIDSKNDTIKNESPQPLSPNKYKLDKAYSLDSHHSSYQSSFSSINLASMNTSIANSDSSSNSSINQFQYYRQQFLTPPPPINYNNNIENINADFKITQ